MFSLHFVGNTTRLISILLNLTTIPVKQLTFSNPAKCDRMRNKFIPFYALRKSKGWNQFSAFWKMKIVNVLIQNSFFQFEKKLKQYQTIPNQTISQRSKNKQFRLWLFSNSFLRLRHIFWYNKKKLSAILAPPFWILKYGLQIRYWRLDEPLPSKKAY